MSLMLLAGCVANANYGNLRGNKEVTKAFKAYQVLPDYKYFSTGPNGRPYAIMGIHNNYKILLQTLATGEPHKKPDENLD
ncbi:MAG: hypothetical protein JRF27_04635 [Deltaproteobacteria bacterium]|nr:hypothetical protein [Deltaproteobacteria bacterium]MBW2193059.1 hypothetical protein [Deltaproteobacteria bacterium]